MAKVRGDLEGVIFARTSSGPVMLSAGDDIPDGVELAKDDIAAPAKRTRRKAVTADESDHDGNDSDDGAVADAD